VEIEFAKSRGAIANVTSIAGTRGVTFAGAAYSISKAAATDAGWRPISVPGALCRERQAPSAGPATPPSCRRAPTQDRRNGSPRRAAFGRAVEAAKARRPYQARIKAPTCRGGAWLRMAASRGTSRFGRLRQKKLRAPYQQPAERVRVRFGSCFAGPKRAGRR
jgi:hypothetical protein